MITYREVLGMLKQAGYINGKWVPDVGTTGAKINGKPVIPPPKNTAVSTATSSPAAPPRPYPTSSVSAPVAGSPAAGTSTVSPQEDPFGEMKPQPSALSNIYNKARNAAWQGAYQVNDAYRKTRDAVQTGFASTVGALNGNPSYGGTPTGNIQQFRRQAWKRPTNRHVPRINTTPRRYSY